MRKGYEKGGGGLKSRGRPRVELKRGVGDATCYICRAIMVFV